MNRFIIIVSGLLVMHMYSFAQDGWILKKEKDGIVIYTRESAESNLKEYRASATIDHPLPDVFNFLKDLEYRPEWVVNCKGLEIIDTLENGQIRYHTAYDIPWPVADRDLVVVADFSAGSDMQKAEMLTLHTDFEHVLEKGIVRMPAYREHVILEAIDPSRTRFTAEGYADPGGSLPAWIVNMFMVEGMYDSMIRTREEIDSRHEN